MSDTLGHEFTPGSVITGSQPQPGQPSQMFPGLTTQQPPKPVTRPTFMSAFLQNLGPALGAAAGAGNFAEGLGKGMGGIQENQRYQQAFKMQQQAAQEKAQVDASENANRNSQMQRRDVQNLKDLTPTDKPDLAHNTITTDQGIMQYNPATSRYDIPAGKSPAPKTPAENDFDKFYTQYITDNKVPDTAQNKLKAHQLWTTNPTTAGNQTDTRLDKSYQFNATQLEKLRTPIDASVDRLARLNDSISQKTPQADAFLAPELLSVMAGGQGSGLRMNESEISRIIGGSTKLTQLKTALNKWSTDPNHATFTDDQRNQMRTLMQAVQARVQQKQSVLNDAQQNLVEATDVKNHRQIIADTQKKLMQIDSGNYQSQIQGMKLPAGFQLETH